MSITGRALAGHLRTFFSFGLIQAAQMALPLLALPWLGRKLGPDAFGLLMYMCVIPPIVALFMDWGITLGAARQIATCRQKSSNLAWIAGSVFSAKILLASSCLAVAAIAIILVPHALAWPGAYFLAVGLGICRGISPVWYFQGMGGNAGRLACYDVGASLAALALVFVFIRKPDDWPLYLLFICMARGFAYGKINLDIWLRYRPPIHWRQGFAMLRDTRNLFGGALSAMIYTNGAQMALGYFLQPAQMGLIVATGKILRALASVINPLTQTIFPHVCALRDKNTAKARYLLRCSLCGSILIMLLAAGIIQLSAPWIMRAALGPDYEHAATVLRLMILAAPFMAADYTLGAQTLVPFGKEKAQLKIQAFMAALSVPLAAMLAINWGLEGSALLPLLVESGIFAGLLWAIRRECPEAMFNK